jgi:hypothetical protein
MNKPVFSFDEMDVHLARPGGLTRQEALAAAAEAVAGDSVGDHNNIQLSLMDMLDYDLRNVLDVVRDLKSYAKMASDNEEVKNFFLSLCAKKQGKDLAGQIKTGLGSLIYKVTGISPMILQSRAKAYAERHGHEAPRLTQTQDIPGVDVLPSEGQLLLERQFHAAVNQEAHGLYSSFNEEALEVDWDQVREYSDGPSKSKGLYLGRFCVNPFYKKGPSKNLTQRDSGSIRQWVIDIRFSADYENPNRFTPICKLGLGMMAYELKSIKDFINSFYQSPERLKWRKVGTGKKQRWSVWAPAYKDGRQTGWLWSPLTYKSSNKVDWKSGGKRFEKKPRTILQSPDGLAQISARKADWWIQGTAVLRAKIERTHKELSTKLSGAWVLKGGRVERMPEQDYYQLLFQESVEHDKLCCQLPDLQEALAQAHARGPDLLVTLFKRDPKGRWTIHKDAIRSIEEWGSTVSSLLKQGWEKVVPQVEDYNAFFLRDWAIKTLTDKGWKADLAKKAVFQDDFSAFSQWLVSQNELDKG